MNHRTKLGWLIWAWLLAQSASVHAQSPYVTEINADGNSVAIIGYLGSGGAVSIPYSLNGLTVTALGDFSFANCSNLTSISFSGGGIASIGQGTFSNCTRLTSFAFSGGSLTNIGDSAFFGSGLTGVSIPGSGPGQVSVTLGANVCAGCPHLTSVAFNYGATTIPAGMFYQCSTLGNITIPASVTNIGLAALADCTNLASISVNAGSTSYSTVSGVLFNYNKSTLVQYPAKLSGSSYTVPATVTNIAADAFMGCSNLRGLTLPSSLINIGDNAFYGCTSLTTLTLPVGVTNIGTNVFYGCTSLESITVNSPNPAFASVSGVLYNGTTNVLLQVPDKLGGTLTIPTNVTSIAGAAFAGCNVTGVGIPASITNLTDVFGFCPQISSVSLSGNNTNYSDYSGVLYNYRETSLVYYPGGKTGNYVIPLGQQNSWVICGSGSFPKL